MKAKNYLKRVVATLLALMLLLPASGVGKFEAKSKEKFNIKGYANRSGALIEWKKVNGAKKYKLYRKKGSEKYKKIKTIKESYFYHNGTDNRFHKRWAVDAYETLYWKKKCKYKIKTDNNKTSNVFIRKKGKKPSRKSSCFSYPELEEVNKMRKSEKLPVLYWCHKAQKGSKIRCKELLKKYEHTRPNGKKFSSAFEYMPNELRSFSENLTTEFNASKAGAKEAVASYMNSKGHRANILRDYGYSGSFVSRSNERCDDGSVDNFFVFVEAIAYTKEKKTNSETLAAQNDIQLKKAEAAELFAPMLSPDFASQYKDRDVDELFNEFKNNGWLNNAISKLGETKVHELFKEFVNNDLANKTKEYGEWLLKVVALIN